ncbi:MAG: hypothetical protein L7U72_18840 [Rubripirellula sp.]|nr:hypothetical protein [Rubripirellula sp.]
MEEPEWQVRVASSEIAVPAWAVWAICDAAWSIKGGIGYGIDRTRAAAMSLLLSRRDAQCELLDSSHSMQKAQSLSGLLLVVYC